MAQAKKPANKSKKKPIEQYDHKGKKRVNNPPVGLVTPATDKESGKKTYASLPPVLIASAQPICIVCPLSLFDISGLPSLREFTYYRC